MPFTCSKRFGLYPFAHRQWQHVGHCRWIHGHNWEFELEFQSKDLDLNYFVADFGLFKSLQNYFDHTLVLNEDDPQLLYFKEMQLKDLVRLTIVPHASAEGLAKFVFDLANEFVIPVFNGRVTVKSVICYEDGKNSARYGV